MELPDLPAPVLKALMDVPISEDEWRGDHGFALLDVMHLSPGERCQLWITHRAELLRAWIEDRPGTRPQMWWHHDAPRQPLGRFPGWWCDGKVEQPRLRLGGIGTAALDAFDAQPKYHLGIPTEWCGPEELEWCAEEGIRAVAIDPTDPPRYESQGAYLKRHGLFLRGEEKRLPANAFEPEAVGELAPMHDR